TISLLATSFWLLAKPAFGLPRMNADKRGSEEAQNRSSVLHPKSETEVISPLSRKGAASGESKRGQETRAAVLASGGGQGNSRRAFSGRCLGVGSGSERSGAVGEEAGSGSGRVEEGTGREGTGGGFFARCLAQGRGATPAERKRWRAGVYDQIQEVTRVQGRELEGKLEEGKSSGGLSVERMCQVAVVSRAGYYRSFAEQCPEEEEVMVRSVIQKVVVEHRRRYGYRRVWFELNHKLGMVVNHKRVLRLMQEDNLLALHRKQFVMTSDSNHSLEIALNLARHMKLTGVNQLWVADITYIRVQKEFVYLAVVMDAYSRKVVGWELSRSLSSGLAVKALQQAIVMRQPSPGLVHHSDRGVQYASREYVELLAKHQMVASMSRPGNPYDN